VISVEGQAAFNGAQSGGKQVSLADLIVMGGCAAIEEAARRAGHAVKVPFAPGRTDASQEQTDVDAFAVLEPLADGFRNYVRSDVAAPAEELLVDRAQLMELTAPKMTLLIGAMRALNASVGQSKHGVFTSAPETLTNRFFVNLLDMNTVWIEAKTGNTNA
jgi:catalase-peroxidase